MQEGFHIGDLGSGRPVLLNSTGHDSTQKCISIDEPWEQGVFTTPSGNGNLYSRSVSDSDALWSFCGKLCALSVTFSNCQDGAREEYGWKLSEYRFDRITRKIIFGQQQVLWLKTFPTSRLGPCRQKRKPARFNPKKKPFVSIFRPSRPLRRRSSCRRCHREGQRERPVCLRLHPLHPLLPRPLQRRAPHQRQWLSVLRLHPHLPVVRRQLALLQRPRQLVAWM